MNEALNAKLDAYYAARRDYEAKKKVSNEAYAAWRRTETAVIDAMLENQVKSLERDDGTKPSLVRSATVSVTKDNFDEIRQWLTEQVGDDKDFVDTVVSKPAVLAFVKKLVDKEKWDETDFPACLSVSTRPTLRVAGWRSLDDTEGDE